MVKLFIGKKGSGKTKLMVDSANEKATKAKGSIVFIDKDDRLQLNLSHEIRIICMDDYEHITNSDEYIGFLYGIISSDHDIDTIYIDGILKHADISMEIVPKFIERIKNMSEMFGVEFVVSISGEKADIVKLDFKNIEILN